MGILFSASALVLSLDRSVGGRLFGGIVFIGTVCTGASIGEAARQPACPLSCLPIGWPASSSAYLPSTCMTACLAVAC